MIGVIYEDGQRHELPADIALALRALGLGYGHIKPMHASYLKTFELCFRGIDGYQISEEGRNALAAWNSGNDYDPRTYGREREAAAGAAPRDPPPAGGQLLPGADAFRGAEPGEDPALPDVKPVPGGTAI